MVLSDALLSGCLAFWEDLTQVIAKKFHSNKKNKKLSYKTKLLLNT